MQRKTYLAATSWTLLLSLAFVHLPLRADSTGVETVREETTVSELGPDTLYTDEGDEDSEPQGTPVSEEAPVQNTSKRKEFIRNIILASVAVVVAVVSALWASNNNGKQKNS